jgi:N,N-dimethylformamidase
MIPELIGYADRFSVAPGEAIRFMVSADHPSYQADIVRLIHADENPASPGFKEKVIETSVSRQYVGRKQIAYSGSYVVTEHHLALNELKDFTLQMWIYPTLPKTGQVQGLLSKWQQSEHAGFCLFVGGGGYLGVWLGDGSGHVDRVHTEKPMRAHEWYFVAATYSAASREVTLYQIPLANWPLDDSAVVLRSTVQAAKLGTNPSPLLIAAAHAEKVDSARVVGRMLYNGKIDSPRIFARALSQNEIDALRQDHPVGDVVDDSVVALWDFAAHSDSAKVIDTGPHRLQGTAINMPMRAVTGHNWTSTEFDFKRAPQQYGAIYFHEDDLDDAGWEVDFEWTVPDGLRSGVYAARLRAGDDSKQEDHIPFFVRPRKGTASAPILVLAPTMTYLAYANDRLRTFSEDIEGVGEREVTRHPLDDYLAEHPEYAASIYDVHSDNSGYCYSSRRRPIITMRPRYRYWIVGGPRHFAADLYLIDWLEQKGFEYDIVTDEDLHFEGEGLLARYCTVITGSHPEYWTTPMRAGLESYLNNGGKLMYLGGNGFYWVTSVDPTRPHVIEVRRGTGGTRAWNSAPGEAYHSTTGEMGGLWRHRGKAPNQLSGIGFSSMGWDGAAGYVRQPGSLDERAAFIFAGVDADEVIGNFGLVLGGAAGDELDAVDYELGTPPHTLILASSTGHSRFILPVIENTFEISASLAAGHVPDARADMVYFETPNQGAVFATGSITWFASLSHNDYKNNVSRITENVLRRFMQER